MSKTVCYYHSDDLDGKCSGAIARLAHPDAILIGYNYEPIKGDFPPQFEPGDAVLMVDCSFPPEVMLRLKKTASAVVWIDHHQTAIQDSVTHGYDTLPGLREIGRAACELAWQRFMTPRSLYDNPIPNPVFWLGRYDVFDHEDPAVLPFQYGMRSEPISWNPDDEDSWALWKILLSTRRPCHESFNNGLLKSGAVVWDYVQKQAKVVCSATGKTVWWEDGFWYAINSPGANSITGRPGVKGYHVGLLIYSHAPDGSWQVGLYNETGLGVNCGDIAKRYGGGGHAKAAGFRAAELLFSGPVPADSIQGARGGVPGDVLTLLVER